MVKYFLRLLIIAIFSLIPTSEIFSTAQPDSVDADKLYQKAGDYWRDVKFDSSNYYYEKAAAIFKENKNWQRYIDCQNNIGINSRYLGKYSDAISHLENGLDAAGNLNEKQDSVRSELYNNIGLVYYEKEYYDKAYKYYRDMLELNEKTFGTKNTNTGKAYQNVGLIYYSTGDYDTAIRYFERALSIFNSNLDKNNPLLANCYTNMSKAYRKKGEYSKSIEYEEKAIKIWIDKLGESHPYIALSYNNLAGIYNDNGDYSNALEYDYKAMQIRRDIAGEESGGVAQSYTEIGDVFTKMQNFNNGRYFLDKSIAIYKKISPSNPGLADAYILSGNLHRLKSEYKIADAYYDSALTVAWPGYSSADTGTIDTDNMTNKKQFLEALIEKGNTLYIIAERSSDRTILKNALNLFKSASDMLEKLSIGFVGDGYEWMPGNVFYELNKKGVLAAVKLYELTNNRDYIETAFRLAERNKANIMAESATKSDIKKFTGLPDSLIINEKELKADISFYGKKLEAAEESNDLKAIWFNRKMVLDSRSKYDDLISYIGQNFPSYYKFMFPEQISSADDLRKLLAPDAAVLEYLTGDTTINIFVLTAGSLNAVTISCDSDFTNNVIKLRQSLPERNYISYLSSASELYSKLIRPVKKYLGDIKRIYIIPDDLLTYLPFETLLTRPGSNIFDGNFVNLPYLIKDYNISYQYSGGLLKENLLHKNNNPNKSFAAFLSVFSADTMLYKTGSADISDKNFSPDPGTAAQVMAIAGLFKENNYQSYVFSNKDSIENQLKTDKISGYKFLHFAVKAFINEEPPELSGLIFYNPEDSAGSGILYAKDIANLKLNADLLVVGSCEISLGKVVKSEGIYSFVHSIHNAGAENIIIPLWQDTDNSKSFLMQNFYKNILDGMDYESALRQTKLEMIEEEQYAYPLKWGSLILLGR